MVVFDSCINITYEVFHGPPVGAHLAENILFGNNISFEQEWPRKLGWILFGSWMFKMCEISLNIRQNTPSLMVGARGTLRHSTYSKTSICFKWNIFALSLVTLNLLKLRSLTTIFFCSTCFNMDSPIVEVYFIKVVLSMLCYLFRITMKYVRS